MFRQGLYFDAEKNPLAIVDNDGSALNCDTDAQPRVNHDGHAYNAILGESKGVQFEQRIGADSSVRRDQRAVCFAPRAARCPVPLSTTPVPLRKPRARHERASAMCRRSCGLPSAARRRALRSGSVPLGAPLRLLSTFPLAARRPKPSQMGQERLIFRSAFRPREDETGVRS